MIVPNTDTGVRPAGPQDRCFYCSSPIGEHKPDCVCLTRTVVLELKIRIVVEVPRNWDRHDIEFLYNESSHCIGNELKKIAKAVKDVPVSDDPDETVFVSPNGCGCGCTEVIYLSEAEEKNNKAIDLTKVSGGGE